VLPVLPDYPDEQPLTTRQAGKIAGKHPRTIISWIKAGHLKTGKMPGLRGQYRIAFGDLKALLKRMYVPD